MSYIVWTDNLTEGWARSDDLSTLADVLDHIGKNTYGHDYVITETVEVELKKKQPTMTFINNSLTVTSPNGPVS